MARRPLSERHIRNIQRSNGSYYITVPIDIIRDLKWQDRQKVVVKRRGSSIIINDWS